ncbi:peptide ABC transporter permease [Anaerocolumna cellulosilytica]|uniref:Peptide ABC transporter permease n=1 Tax=Anaerocolumna cellulosilytica TaxID=433286 RepID=A0A6S6R9I1_9FIRM|nr:ABC transporter permease [Anaerocolumna cellulosilytica]MBB5196518.1 oligopeptide transport system permease protein [Anaerocolumna cellulosilytica]BCJ95618.1 peptide ABC transporter permease [Anaerocolumna cellulosilytica]
MGKYILKRIVAALLTIFIAATITFFIMNFVPGNPFLGEKPPSESVMKALMEKYGLDKPLVVQYKNYLLNLLKGDFGISYKLQKNRAIIDIIKESFPVSAKLGAWAILLAILGGIPLGSIAAFKRNKLGDNIIRIFSTMGISIPGFVIATTTMILFAVKLKILPSSGLNTLSGYILPIFTLSLYPMCYIARLMRSSMLEAFSQDYIRTAKAKGMGSFVITFKHALRNSLIPVITYLGPLVANVLTGAFVVEQVFNIPGLGRYFVKAINARDYMVIMGTTVFLATFVILMNLLCDILYKVVDPRIKLGEE